MYINCESERERIDREWLESNKDLEFGSIPHPYGDDALSGYGINKLKDHKYSKF